MGGRGKCVDEPRRIYHQGMKMDKRKMGIVVMNVSNNGIEIIQ